MELTRNQQLDKNLVNVLFLVCSLFLLIPTTFIDLSMFFYLNNLEKIISLSTPVFYFFQAVVVSIFSLGILNYKEKRKEFLTVSFLLVVSALFVGATSAFFIMLFFAAAAGANLFLFCIFGLIIFSPQIIWLILLCKFLLHKQRQTKEK